MRAFETAKLIAVAAFIVLGLAFLLLPQKQSLARAKARVLREFPEIPHISTSSLAEELEKPGETRPWLFDIRTREEFEVSHLPGAILLLPETPAKDVLKTYNNNRSSVLYCSVGYRASKMARALQREGRRNVSVLDGSVFQWSLENRPLENRDGATSLVHPHSASYLRVLPARARPSLPSLGLIANELPPIERWRLFLGTALLAVFLMWETFDAAAKNPGAAPGRLRHGWRNYVLGLINIVVVGVIFAKSWIWLAAWADTRQFGLLNWIRIPTAGRLAIAILLLDLWTYSWHWLNHHVPLLWRFHRTHHTDPRPDVTSSVRFHFGEIAISAALRLPLIVLLGLHFHELVIYELLLFSVVQFQHANITLPRRLDRFLSWIIVTPFYHRIHHSDDVTEANSNFSSLLTVWDRLFQTRWRLEKGPVSFGVLGFKEPRHQKLTALLETPFE
jgi:sterol desaturase/sphingolipid hydroxylase (fatty acid hydroxylase superfamily)/rhodanese-related sulfurtransferase